MASKILVVGAWLGSVSALHLHKALYDETPAALHADVEARKSFSESFAEAIKGHGERAWIKRVDAGDVDLTREPDVIPDDPFVNFYEPRGDIQRPRMLAMRGCSGSSAVMVFARNLLRFHGVPVPRAAEPRFNENGGPVPPADTTALPAELLNPKINWLYYSSNHSIGQAMKKMNEKVVAKNQTLFFKGMIQHLQGKGTGNDEWEDVHGAFKDLGMYVVLGSRTNMLDQVICQVKDCFQEDYGQQVDAETGAKSNACFKRRGEQVNPTETAADANQGLVRQRHKSRLSVALDNAAHLWFGDDGYKAKLNIDNLMKSIEHEFEFVENAKKNMKSIGLKFEIVAEEDLLEFQTPVEGAFRRGVAAWSKLLKSFGVEPDPNLVATFLSKYAKTYHKPPAHWEVIYNYDDVEAKLRGSRYEHLLRW